MRLFHSNTLLFEYNIYSISRKHCKFSLFSVCIFLLLSSPLLARTELKIVGSGTVYPYAHAVSQAYAKRYDVPVPKIIPGGSGRGFKKFCAGIGEKFPDITNASRPMKYKEWKLCQKNGVYDITEVQFGSDGIALVTSQENTDISNLTSLQLYKALSEYVPVNNFMVKNPYRNWSEIDPALPDRIIQIHGPGKTDGTYYVMTKRLIRKTCEQKLGFFNGLKYSSNKAEYKKQLKKYCSHTRSDGIYTSTSAGPEQILKTLKSNKKALFFIGYSVLFTNRKQLRAISINNVEPRVYTISDKSYILNRPLFFYIKNQHRKLVPEINNYVKEFMSNAAMDTFGYLLGKGLGVLSVEKLKDAQYAVAIGSKIRRFENIGIKQSRSKP